MSMIDTKPLVLACSHGWTRSQYDQAKRDGIAVDGCCLMEDPK